MTRRNSTFNKKKRSTYQTTIYGIMKLQLVATYIVVLLISLAESYPFESLRTLQIDDENTITVRESEKFNLLRRGIKFIDVTNHIPFFGKGGKDKKVVPDYSYPTSVAHSDIVTNLTNLIDQQSMYNNLAKFTSFFTRYYKSETGYESAQWLLTKIHEITENVPEGIITIEQFEHPDWKQFSIIVRINGVISPENIIVLGSHQDSMNLLLPSLLAAPGADDNGSGTVTNLEALRIYCDNILSHGQQPENTIEFHFYSAEEGGLLGSLDVFTDYAKANKKVVAMLQQDMTGYVPDKDNEHVGVITDYTTPKLTDFIKLVIESYLDIPYVESECGYACSDHGSALKNGFPASFVIESDFKKTNKYIHSTMDTLDRLSFEHMAEHVKIVLGTVIELGSWTKF